MMPNTRPSPEFNSSMSVAIWESQPVIHRYPFLPDVFLGASCSLDGQPHEVPFHVASLAVRRNTCGRASRWSLLGLEPVLACCPPRSFPFFGRTRVFDALAHEITGALRDVPRVVPHFKGATFMDAARTVLDGAWADALFAAFFAGHVRIPFRSLEIWIMAGMSGRAS